MTVAKSDVKGMTVFNTNKVNTKKQPMFFGQPLGVQRYDSYKYPVFDRLTTQQLGYFWRPEEVSLQKDRNDYAELRPEQKSIFTSNLKYQTMLDSVQGRGPALAFLPFVSLPELESCILTWDFMETIHSRSYTYIIKNLYPNPNEVFDTIIETEYVEFFTIDTVIEYVDVIITDGFSGNIALKTAEGTANFITSELKNAMTGTLLGKISSLLNISNLKKFKKRLDPRLYNGAIFIGLDSPVVKSHGGTDHIGFSNSLDVCHRIVKGNLIEKIKQNI